MCVCVTHIWCLERKHKELPDFLPFFRPDLQICFCPPLEVVGVAPPDSLPGCWCFLQLVSLSALPPLVRFTPAANLVGGEEEEGGEDEEGTGTEDVGTVEGVTADFSALCGVGGVAWRQFMSKSALQPSLSSRSFQ